MGFYDSLRIEQTGNKLDIVVIAPDFVASQTLDE
jgi:hypothetical protein